MAQQQGLILLQPYLTLEAQHCQRIPQVGTGIAECYEFTISANGQSQFPAVPDGSVDETMVFRPRTNVFWCTLSARKKLIAERFVYTRCRQCRFGIAALCLRRWTCRENCNGRQFASSFAAVFADLFAAISVIDRHPTQLGTLCSAADL